MLGQTQYYKRNKQGFKYSGTTRIYLPVAFKKANCRNWIAFTVQISF